MSTAQAPKPEGTTGHSPAIESENTGYPDQAQPKPKPAPPPAAVTEQTEQKKQPASTDKSEDESTELQREDLKAQRSMANSARDLVAPTWWGVGIGGLGSLLVAAALVLNYYGLRAARESIQVAEATLEHTRETAQRELRAYVHIIQAGIENVVITGVPKIRIVIKNVGQTPARKVTNSVYAGLGPPNETSFPAQVLIDEPPFVLGPGLTSTKYANVNFSLMNQGMADLNMRRCVLYIFGVISYADVFGTIRTTKYCYVYNPALGSAGPLEIHKMGNDAD